MKRYKLLLPFLCFSMVSCKGFLDIAPPKSQVKREEIFKSDPTAIAALLNVYARTQDGAVASGRNNCFSFMAGLSADELTYISRSSIQQVQFEKNDILVNNNIVLAQWTSSYSTIYGANAVIQGIEEGSGVSEQLKAQLKGEALFIRAFFHFYLVNIFGEVPLILTTDYEANAIAGRTPVDKVYEQIISDLELAKSLMEEAYPGSIPNIRTRANRSAARAMLARIYLYRKNWAAAELNATEIINRRDQYILNPDLSKVFTRDNIEAIWQVQPLDGNGRNDSYTNEATVFTLQNVLKNYVFTDVMAQSFETGDQRRTNWVNSVVSGSNTFYFPQKYKEYYSGNPIEAATHLRLAEIYLIRAEARAEQENLTGANSAASDIDSIRLRAGLLPTTATSKATLLEAIEQERKVELFSEWGHRWLDLRRWGKADAVLAPFKGATWKSTDVLYPIPELEMRTNYNLKPQNSGY